MRFRKILPYMWVATGIAILYVAWFFWNRYESDRAFRRAVENKKLEPDRQTAEMLGTSVKVLNFYVYPGVISRGGHSTMCYGVANAKRVEMAPPVDGIWPSVSRCLNVSPKQTTTYTLTAFDDAGHKASESATIEVR